MNTSKFGKIDKSTIMLTLATEITNASPYMMFSIIMVGSVDVYIG